MTSKSTPLDKDYNFCDATYTETIKYYLTYIPVLYQEHTLGDSILTMLDATFKSSCNSLLIHVDFRDGKGGNDDALFSKVVKMLNDYFGGHRYEIPKVIYSFANDKLLSRDDFPSLVNLRVLNVVDTAEKLRTEQDVIRFLPLDEYDDDMTLTSESSRLTCQWWFKRFFATVFECGKGRLVQFSGTCYMTSVFNSIILGEYAKRILIKALNRCIDDGIFSSTDIAGIKRPIVSGVCIDSSRITELTERLKYYAKIFYNTICVTKSLPRIEPRYQDIFELTSSTYFSTYAMALPKYKKEGGHATSVILTCLLDFDIKFCVLDRNNDFYSLPPHGGKADAYLLAERLRKLGWKYPGLYLTPLDKPLNVIDPDIILYIDYEGDNPPPPPPVVDGYIPETSTIALTFYKGLEIHGHSICGFVCDGSYKIYDSAYNTIDNCNWLDPAQLSNNDYTRRMQDFYGWKIESIFLTSVIYINASKRLQYITEGVCKL